MTVVSGITDFLLSIIVAHSPWSVPAAAAGIIASLFLRLSDITPED